jgi:hypothetical protein
LPEGKIIYLTSQRLNLNDSLVVKLITCVFLVSGIKMVLLYQASERIMSNIFYTAELEGILG